MASTTFVDGETLIEASWLNDVNAVVYTPGTSTAADIANVPNTGTGGNIAATDVQAALNELDIEKQPLDAQLTTLSGITAQQATDLAALSTFIGTLLNDADATTARATLGLVIGTNVQAYTISPSFSVHKNGTNQTISSATYTKVTWSTEEFDTNSNFASDRFTPTVAGKYLLSATLQINNTNNGYQTVTSIYKNGVLYKEGRVFTNASMATGAPSLSVVVDANGSTDYFEVYAYAEDVAGGTIVGTSSSSFFSGSKIA